MFNKMIEMESYPSSFPKYYGCYVDDSSKTHLFFEAVEFNVNWEMISHEIRSQFYTDRDKILNQLDAFLIIAKAVDFFQTNDLIVDDFSPSIFKMTEEGTIKLYNWRSVIPRSCFKNNDIKESIDSSKYSLFNLLEPTIDYMNFVKINKFRNVDIIWSLGMTIYFLAALDKTIPMLNPFKNLSEDPSKDIMPQIRQTVISNDWIDKHALDIRSKKSKLSFSKILENMMIIDRSDRAKNASSSMVVNNLQDLIDSVGGNNYEHNKLEIGQSPAEKGNGNTKTPNTSQLDLRKMGKQYNFDGKGSTGFEPAKNSQAQISKDFETRKKKNNNLIQELEGKKNGWRTF